jgi:hypothetical protein
MNYHVTTRGERVWISASTFLLKVYHATPKRGEVSRGWRRLHNEELHNLYTSPDIIRVIESKEN